MEDRVPTHSTSKTKVGQPEAKDTRGRCSLGEIFQETSGSLLASCGHIKVMMASLGKLRFFLQILRLTILAGGPNSCDAGEAHSEAGPFSPFL